MCWKGSLGRPTEPRHSSDSSPQRWMCLASYRYASMTLRALRHVSSLGVQI